MILHLFLFEKFTDDYIDFINHNFNIDEHLFIVYKYNKIYNVKNLACKNVIYCKKVREISKYKNYLNNCEKIIMHGFYSFLLPFYIYPYIKKIYIVFWGGDIYDMRNSTKSIEKKLRVVIKKIFISNVKGIITLIEGDLYILKKYCNPKGKHFLGSYGGGENRKKLLEENRDLNKANNPVLILVGNSATRENQHSEVFDILEKYKQENIQIIVPLSYGDNKYRDQVIRMGEQKFGKKFLALTEFIPEDDYMKLLTKCKVGIFNNNRQQALGNIDILTFFGAKVYIRSDTVMWDEFIIKNDFDFFDVESIRDLCFTDFLYIDEESINKNYEKKRMKNRSDDNKKLWDTIFNDKD